MVGFRIQQAHVSWRLAACPLQSRPDQQRQSHEPRALALHAAPQLFRRRNTLWWGFGCFALATEASLWTIASPILMSFLIVKVSGVALLEKGLGNTKPKCREYVRRKSAFFPRPPRG